MNGLLDSIKNPNDIKNLNIEKFPELAAQIRKLIIDVVSKNGGHLAGSLGVVELTMALNYVFDLEKDKIVWDVGHQAYAHKILTGRSGKFHTLRQWKGISGFPNMSESKYDAFGTGHSSTSISSALGIASARDLKREDSKVIAVIGDGAMTGGLAFEGLNNAGHLGKDLIVVLNDNEMFISKRVGAIGKYLTKAMSGDLVVSVEQRIEKISKRFKIAGETIMRIAKRVKTLLTPGMMFEEMGFCYLGPIDGHDIMGLIDIFKNIKNLKGSVLLHIITKKGKGCKFAEERPELFHGVGKFDAETGEVIKSDDKVPTYTQVFGDTLIKIAEEDKQVVVITAAMSVGTGVDKFAEKFPDRYFDVGIAEGHAVTFAAGLAANGMKPVCAIYSTFMHRAYDNIIHDVCLQNLPVIFALDRAGIVGEDGATHNGQFDLSYLRLIPNLVVMAPSNEKELQMMLKTAVSYNGPVAIRYPRGKGIGLELFTADIPEIKIGEPEVIEKKGEIAVVSIGSMVEAAKEAVLKLKNQGIQCALVNARFAKPINKLVGKIKNYKKIITVEENTIIGGFGSAISEQVDLPVYNIGLPDEFVKHGNQEVVRDACGLSSDAIYKRIKGIQKQ
ncbi:1-deoxy-D-xylulose-5-phosphate synthase [bacterium]